MMQYLLNGFLFFIPVFIWNAIFYKKLPEFYQTAVWDNIPKVLDVTENILRFSSFLIPLLFRIDFSTNSQRIGLVLYLAGIIVYFSSWLIQIIFKDKKFSGVLLLRAAPAYTTIIWLMGIGLIGKHAFLPNIRKIYIPAIAAFVVVHTFHSYIVWKKSVDYNHTGQDKKR